MEHLEDSNKRVLGVKEAYKSIINDSEFLKDLEVYCSEEKVSKGDCNSKIKEYLYEIAGNKSNSRIFWKISQFLSWFLILRKFDNVNIDMKGLKEIKKISNKNSIILVSNHRSIFDFFIMPYSFVTRIGFMPVILSGTIFNIFVIGKLFRRWGTYFIRRGEKDKLYLLVFKYYLFMLIRKGVPQLFFIEGGRSRNGKVNEPKKGMLKWIFQGREKFPVEEDIAFIPVNVSYDIVPEAEILIGERESGNKAHIKHSLKKYFKFSKEYGNCNVTFGQVISYKSVKDKGNVLDSLAENLIKDIRKIGVITFPSLICKTLKDTNNKMSKDEIIESVISLIKTLKDKNIDVNNLKIDNIERAFYLMEKNQIISINGQDVGFKNKDLVEYYNNSISDLFI